MNEQDLYRLALEYLNIQNGLPRPQFDIGRIVGGVDDAAKRILGRPHGDVAYALDEKQRDLVHEIVWDLIVQRILTIDGQGYPWLRITEYGKTVIKNPSASPYDRDGYISQLKARAPKISTLTTDYIGEAIICFRGGAQKAASVMLGVAAEEIYSDLIRAFEKKYSKQIFSKNYKPFKQVRDLFDRHFAPVMNDLPSECKDNIENTVGGVYELIKKMRDDSGHPTDTVITRDEVYANFSVLPLYAERIYKVVDFYN